MKYIFIIIIFLFISCEKIPEKSTNFRDYTCKEGFQDEYYKCLKEKLKHLTTTWWESRCRDIIIASHCQGNDEF